MCLPEVRHNPRQEKDGGLQMTKLKDLEKRIDNTQFIILLIGLATIITLIAYITWIYHLNNVVYETDYLNPCELGLMDWEEEIKCGDTQKQFGKAPVWYHQDSPSR